MMPVGSFIKGYRLSKRKIQANKSTGIFGCQMKVNDLPVMSGERLLILSN